MAKAKPAAALVAEPTDAELYGEVKPTMVNGVFIGDAPAPKAELTLAQRIAGAFTNEAQIAVLHDLLAVAEGREPRVPSQSTSVDDQRVADLEAQVEYLSTLLAEQTARVDALTQPDPVDSTAE
jgi:hypothetical protein